MRQHELAHVLPGNTHDVGHVGQSDQIGCDFDQPSRRYGAAHVRQRTAHCGLCTGRLTAELQRQPPRLADPDQGIVATGFAQAFDQRVRDAIIAARRGRGCRSSSAYSIST
jgi:hypothetical protein